MKTAENLRLEIKEKITLLPKCLQPKWTEHYLNMPEGLIEIGYLEMALEGIERSIANRKAIHEWAQEQKRLNNAKKN